MAVTSYNGISDELRRAEEERKKAEEAQREAERRAAEEAAKAEAEAAEATAKAEEEAKAASEQAKTNLESLKEQKYAPGEEWNDQRLKAFDEDAQFVMGQHEALQNTKVSYTKKHIGDLPEQLEPLRDEIEASNKSGELKKHGGGAKPWVQNEFYINWGSIKDIDQAVYFGSTLTTLKDKTRFFKEYAQRNGLTNEEVLAYADDKLGTRIFSSPQSNAGKRNAATDALNKIGLFDVNGDDIKVGTADFDTIVQSLNNIANASEAKKAASYVEALTKIPGSPYYGMTFDKDTVEYRDSANLPAAVYKEEVEKLGGLFYTGEGAIAQNREEYLIQYENLQTVYGHDKFAFRQMEKALKNAYEKQTGYVAPDSAQVQDAIKQIQAERELLNAQTEEENKGIIDRFVDWLFPKEKKEEEKDIPVPETESISPVEGRDYSMREGYIASAGPSAGLLAENNQTKAIVEQAGRDAPQAILTEEEETAEAQGPVYQPQATDTAKVVQNQPPMTYMQAMRTHLAGEELSPENEALIADSIGNDDFRTYVANGMMPDPKQLMQERAYGGTVLSDAQARARANSITTGMQLLGTNLGSSAEALATGALPEDVTGAGYQLMADVMNDVSRYIRSGRIAVPAGENKYDYVIGNVPFIKAKADQLAGLQKDVNNITATRAIEAAHDYDKKVEDAEIRYLSGRATQEDLMLLSSRADSNADINNDETRLQFRHQLSYRSMWYADDGAFWRGDSAAAQEGMRLRETHEDGLYGDYRLALWNKANDIIDELSYIATDHGMTLGGWMEKVGLSTDDPSAIMDMAYNRIRAEGVQLEKDPEAQVAVDTLSGVETNGVGMLAAHLGGLGQGLADDTYHFMNAGYMMLDAATYDARRNEVYREYDSKYGVLAPKVYRGALTAYANSGALSKEMSQELLEDIARCENIFDIPMDLDPGLVEGLYLGTMNELSKAVETLEGVREKLPENERRAWDALYGVGTNVPGMIRSTATVIGLTAAGVPLPFAKVAGLWMGYGATTFSRGTKKYEDAGMTRSAAMYMGALEAAGMMATNLIGQDTATSFLTGKALMRNGIEEAFRGGRWFDVVKAIAKTAAPLVKEEAIEEGVERLVEEGVSLAAPVVEAIDRGEPITFSKGVQLSWEKYKGIDVKNLFSEVVQSGMGGAAYGLLFAAPRLAFDTARGRANANIQKQYPSVDIASQIVHGEIPASDENMGRFIDLMNKDLEKPEFRTLLDKRNDSAEQANSMAVAALLGEGKEFKDNALKLTQKADQYDRKAEAAEKAIEINRSQFYIARKAASEGNEGALHTMEGFRAAWGKAQTTATESRQAAEKARVDAAEQTGRWIYACRKLGNDMYVLTKQSAGSLLLSKVEEQKADEMEAGLAEAEASADAMDAEAFIEERYKNHSDADKDHIREIFGVPVGTKKGVAPEATTVAENAQVAEESTEGAPAEQSEAGTATQPSEAIMPAEQTAQEAPEAASESANAAPVQTAAEQETTPVQAAQPATQPAKPMQTQTGAERIEASRKKQIQNAVRFAGQVKRRFGVDTEIVPASDKRLELPKKDKNGNPQYAPALYNRKEDKIIISENATQGDVLRAKIVHELTHRTEGTKAYEEFSKAVLSAYYGTNIESERSRRRDLYAANGVELDPEGLEAEMVAYATEQLIGGNQEMVDRLVADSPSVARRIMDAIKAVLDKLTGAKGQDYDQLRAVENMFKKALDESQKRKKVEGVQHSIPDSVSPDTGDVLTGTVGGDTVVQYSLSSWTPEERSTVRSNLVSHGYDEEAVDDWIDNVDSVAAIVAANKDRLDFEAADNQVMLKPNAEYVKTLDASTLCAKRLLYQGTFNAIQHRMPNKVMTSDDLIRLRNMMAEYGYETPCGICYVESRRRNLGTFAKKWLDGYDAKGGYQPKLDDVTTTDGLERMRTEHPEVYDSFVGEMKRKGSNNPKVVQLRTDYRGDIQKLSKGDTEKIIKIGGLRVQSFSDFETPHLLDMMQAVLDMTDKGLTSQAYTKVPNFAWVFGDTGIKINLSLIAEGDGFDADGNLAFSSYEGMDIDEAMALRSRYSKNVGTILVGLSDKHIRAAMADERIDFIIPFHKSGWGKRQLAQLSGMSGYMDYTRDQNERRVIGETKTGKPKTKNVEENFHPVDYWDYSLTGDQNAEIYLRMCEEDGRIPKFSRFLTKDADGHWVAPSGYWKLLIDFKMYDNDGVGAPQMPVMPNFNMVEARRILDEYEGGADTLPVAHDIVERFVNQTEQGSVQYAIDLDDHYDYSKSFAEQVDDYLNNKIPKGDALILGGTPEIYQKIGLSNLPMTINTGHINDAVYGTRDTEHTLGRGLLAQLPELLKDPIAIIESQGSDGKEKSLVSVVKAIINGKPVIAPIYIGSESKQNGIRIDTNAVSTAFRKNNALTKMLTDAINKENANGVGVYYVNKTEAQNLYAGAGVQFPGSSLQDGLIHSIFDAGSAVKRNYVEQTDTKQFKRWFNGSKAVDGNGKPMILYHGSKNTEIDVFRTKNQWGYGGLHLSRYEDVAQDYAGSDGKVYKLYASIKNPYVVDANNKWYDSIEPTEELKKWRRANGYSANNINLAADTFEFAAYARDAKAADGTARYDGVIVKNVHEQTGQFTDDYIIFEPEQVKSADENIGLFDPKNPNIHYSIDEPTLPDDDFLRAEIDAWRSRPIYSVEGENTGKRQFANQTLPNNPHIPDYIKQAFLNDPAKSDYSRESNMRQLNAAWARVNAEGYEAAANRLINQETKFTTEDNADALILMRQALHDGDLDTMMAVATKYNTEGTDQAKALQIRRLMRTMTPTGFAQTVIQDVSRKIEDRDTKRPGEKRKRERESRETKENLNLGSLDDTSAADTLKSGGSIRIDNKFGAPLNDAKRALIKEFGLEKTARPGDDFYNWATTKQRMLEDILTTDDIWAKDSNGMDLVDRLVRMKHGDIVLTKADLQYITDQMAKFDRLADKNSREADLALARAHEAQGNVNGATGRTKRRIWRYVSMLLSAPSAIRNVIGNTAQALPNAIADGIAVELDRAISKVAGTDRTRAHLTAKERVEGWEAFRDEVFNTFRDYFVDKAITQHGEGRYNQSQIGRVYQPQSLETLRHLEGLLMSVGDRNFWKKKFLNSMAEQQRIAEINGTAFDVEAAMEKAEAEANYATFNEDGTIRSLMAGLTEHIPFLDYLMPFVGVPTNIIKRQIEFSPIGIVSTAIKHGWGAVVGEKFDQRAFVDGMARGLTGSAMMGIGAILLKSGALKLGTKEEDDDKSYGVRTAMGDQYGVYFTVGDKNYSITTFSPAASALVAGAFVMDALDNNESWGQALINATFKNINEIFDASYMSSLADALNTSNGKTIVENLIPAIGSAMITQNIPAPLSHLASSLDPYVRDTKDKDTLTEIINTTMNKIPGARQLLPEKVDVAGRKVENTKQGIAAFVDPFTTSNVVDDPALSEMIRLRDALIEAGDDNPRAHMATDALSGRKNTLTQNKETYTVTPEEKEAYRERYGDLWRNGGQTYDKKGRRTFVDGVEELIRSRKYQLMSDKEKAKAIQEILTAAKNGATYEIMNHK